jgi:DNA repair protein RadA/Sms
MDKRLAEAARLGFTCAVVPSGVTTVPPGLQVLSADNITSALQVLRRISQNGADQGRDRSVG